MEKIDFPLVKTAKVFLPLKNYVADSRYRLAAGLFCLLAVNLLQLLIPVVLKRVVDDLSYRNAMPSVLLKYSMAILIISLLIAIFRYVWRVCILGFSRKVEELLRNRLFSHLQKLSMSFFNRTKTGDIMARSINDINAIRMAAGMGLVSLVDGLTIGIAAIGFMVYISPELTALSLIPAPFIIVVARVYTKRMSKGYDTVQKTFSDLTECVREAFAGIRVVKSFVREDWTFEKVKKEGANYANENIKLARTLAFFFPVMTIFTNIGLAIVLFFGGRLAILGDISTGDFVAFIGYLNLLTWPMMAMGWVTNLFQRGAASMRRINLILDEVPEITEKSFQGDQRIAKGTITFSNVSFIYPEKTTPALHHINLVINSGETVSIAGMVGSGKSTLLHLIPRLIDPSKGSISIDGNDTCSIPLSRLRENIGFITQEPVLFSDTIKNNIVFGRVDISEEKINAALRCARIFDDIMGLESGMDTILGEKGVTLSGGQKQRLTIARAMVLDPPILIIDDALSMIDTRTEEEILNEIINMRRGKTTVIVSHRLSTISRSDVVVVMKDGAVIETGHYKRLLADDSEFSRLYKKQIMSQDIE
ncbi:MAG: ABC transporter ATP-binding protein [Desulfatiglans sp.]|jgi:ATP-binding cassette subfamily B protein|nr:ABC transporter ATP-binding protein [Desulfatiglans sp.]